MRALITGGSGYVGSLIRDNLLSHGHECVNFDIAPDAAKHERLTYVQADVSEPEQIEEVFTKHGPFDAVFHCAAQLLYRRKRHRYFLRSNVHATKFLADACVKHGTKQMVYISSNCVYGKFESDVVREDHPLLPFEFYGQTKAASEMILWQYAGRLNSVMLRAPTIVGEGRLGILSIVYDFIREGRKIWLVGSGGNRYQFVYGPDLAEAARLAAACPKTTAFNVGSDDVPSLNQLFTDVIVAAGTKSRLMHLPGAVAIPGMKLCYHLGISPLGPYQYNMIASSYIGDTAAIREALGWKPTKTNSQMLTGGYRYYINNYDAIHSGAGLAGHRKAGSGGVLNLIKWAS
jgi:nucleoside-diphosphate-sugar epimerase